MNQVKTAMLLAALTALLIFIGYSLAGQRGVVLAIVLAAAMNFTSYWWSDKIVLSMYGARELTGHELSHVKHRDTLITTVTATITGALSMLSNMALWGMMLGGRSRDDDESGNPVLGLIGIIIAPIAAALIQMAISRSREFSADQSGAEVSGDPRALASALRKIESWSRQIPMSGGSPATAHLFIVNPFKEGGLAQLFSTHPPTAARVERLEEMARRLELQGVRSVG